MKIGVIGAGAMGCLLGGFLAKRSNEVYLVDIWEEHVERINVDGLKIDHGDKTDTVVVHASSNPERIGICDAVIVSTKFHHTRQALQSAMCLINADTIVMTVQNGIGNVETISELVGGEQIIYGLTTLGSVVRQPGKIEATFLESGTTYLWTLQGRPTEKEEMFVNEFVHSGLDVRLDPDVSERIWEKICLNAGFSALTAVTRLRCGDLIDQPSSLEIIRGLILEISAIANREGVNIDPDSAFQNVVELARQAPNHSTSILMDVVHKRKTEIESLNGAITAKGAKHGIETPLNTMLSNIIRITESTYNKSLA